jgi:hypothetical protein
MAFTVPRDNRSMYRQFAEQASASRGRFRAMLRILPT